MASHQCSIFSAYLILLICPVKNGGITIPESISFCIRQKYLNDFISNQTDEKPTKESPKTANAKAEVIYSLIEYSFGKEVLKSLRTNLDNKIKAEFTRKGIELPATGQTIEKWLKDAGLIN